MGRKFEWNRACLPCLLPISTPRPSSTKMMLWSSMSSPSSLSVRWKELSEPDSNILCVGMCLCVSAEGVSSRVAFLVRCVSRYSVRAECRSSLETTTVQPCSCGPGWLIMSVCAGRAGGFSSGVVWCGVMSLLARSRVDEPICWLVFRRRASNISSRQPSQPRVIRVPSTAPFRPRARTNHVQNHNRPSRR